MPLFSFGGGFLFLIMKIKNNLFKKIKVWIKLSLIINNIYGQTDKYVFHADITIAYEALFNIVILGVYSSFVI